RKDPAEEDKFRFDSDDDDAPDLDAEVDMTYARISQRAYLLGSSSSQPVSSRRQQLEAGGPSQSPSGPQAQPQPLPTAAAS
ncbi:Enhancer of polycomb-like protein 1, partial [Exophiala xenobiotica]